MKTNLKQNIDVGQKRGKLTIIEYLGTKEFKTTIMPMYKVQCECGKTDIKTQQYLNNRRKNRPSPACISCNPRLGTRNLKQNSPGLKNYGTNMSFVHKHWRPII